jgi:hypothetical protein
MISSRKIVVACSGMMLGLAAASASAAAACPPLPGGALCQAATVLPEAADGVTKAGDAFAHLAELSDEAFRHIAVMIDHGRVQDLIRSVAQMNVNNDAVIMYLKDYQTYGEAHRSWATIRNKIADTLKTATEVERNLNNLSSGLVDQPVYDDLERAISAKGRVLVSLSGIPAPPKDDSYLNDLLTSFSKYAQAIVDAQKQIQAFSRRLASG